MAAGIPLTPKQEREARRAAKGRGTKHLPGAPIVVTHRDDDMVQAAVGSNFSAHTTATIVILAKNLEDFASNKNPYQTFISKIPGDLHCEDVSLIVYEANLGNSGGEATLNIKEVQALLAKFPKAILYLFSCGTIMRIKS